MLPMAMVGHVGRVLLTMVIRRCQIHCRLGKEIATIVPLRDPPSGGSGRRLKVAGKIVRIRLRLLLTTGVVMRVGIHHASLVFVGQGSAIVGVIM